MAKLNQQFRTKNNLYYHFRVSPDSIIAVNSQFPTCRKLRKVLFCHIRRLGNQKKHYFVVSEVSESEKSIVLPNLRLQKAGKVIFIAIRRLRKR